MKGIKEVIKEIVVKELHERGFNIFTDNFKEKADLIVDKVLSGTFAFQLIYDDNFEIESVYDLDWRLVKSNQDQNPSYRFSIDGGKRYQWSYNEILLISVDLIRDLKINNIFN